MVGKSIHHIFNSKYQADDLSDLVVDEGDILNFHEVVSLFISTLISKVLEIVNGRPEKGDLK